MYAGGITCPRQCLLTPSTSSRRSWQGENVYLTDLTYADDIALLGDSAEALQGALDNFGRFAKVVGRWMNASKTKVMSTQPRPGTQHTINHGGLPLE